jgi:hypothetical protein
MPALRDLTGKTVGMLVVVERAENNKHGGSMWLCRCDCGTEKVMYGNYLSTEKAASCGCRRYRGHPNSNLQDLTGKTFERWTVIEKFGNNSNGAALWLCRCECGTEKVLYGGTLKSGNTKSCGCSRRKSRRPSARFVDLTGHTYGDWTVIKRGDNSKSGSTRWWCRCACGVELLKSVSRLRSSTGCLHIRAAEARVNGYISKDGYRVLHRPDHPNARKDGSIKEHVLVMSQMLGRPLNAGEEVHHKNSLRSDNRPENLELWQTSSQPKGARVADLINYVVTYHRDAVEQLLLIIT